MKTAARKKIEKKIWKVSIGDAWNAFAFEVETVADIQTAINQRKTFCTEHKINIQPYIGIIGIDSDKPQFCVVFDSLMYVFENFLNALDTCFKIFFVLNLDYPFECSKLWIFMQKFFFNISLSTDELTSDIIDFITFLNSDN